ncbi:MAG: hypothetical protein E7419_06810 [Ruminococcaceae bacterium]|nr:hypothetical protein [Oscillospiraceae bacterium]
MIMFKKNQEKAVAKKIEKVLGMVAQEHGVSVAEVKKEISDAIAIGMSSNDPNVQKQWENMPSKSGVPTPEEVITWAITKIGTKVSC